jgi:alpha,alpha-trehalose phosphorylase
MLRERLSPTPDRFPPDPWALESRHFDRELAEELVGQIETMFALSNGYLGLRGTWDEGVPAFEPGVFLNGFYEYRPISYGEHAFGFPRRGQSILNCPDGTIIRLFIDDEPFVVTAAEIVSFHRLLDLKQGIAQRDVTWITPFGHRMRLRTTRLVSFAHRHLAAIQYELWAEDTTADVVITSELRHQRPLPQDSTDPRLAVGLVGRVLEPRGADQDGLRAVLAYATAGSRLVLGCGMDHVLDSPGPFASETSCDEDLAAVTFRGLLRPGQPLRLQKYLSYHYAEGNDADEVRRYAQGDDAEQIRSQAGWSLDQAVRIGFAGLLERQRKDVSDFWAHADVEIECGDPRLQQVIRWNLFQLLQATARSEGHGVAARGLTGRTYEGHYFWDTEIYVLPFLIYQEPRIARNILKFRYDGLAKARARASELGHRGATFPWRTINGEEASAYYAAGTAQYHINADIAYAVRKYVDISGDTDFLIRYGAEILVETARFWRSLGFFSERKQGRFCINGVTGPDEYTAVVNNNYFTNLMARENLRDAAETAAWLAAEHPQAFAGLARRTNLAADEARSWRRAADLMYLPHDERLGVHPQDDSFLDKEIWDFAATPEENYPLLLHYHPLNLYRAQVIKQADTLLAMFLLGDQFSTEDKKRNFDYYDPLTTHDSSLSVCIQSIIANEIGYRDKAARYFRFAAVMDMSDVGGNMRHGAHIASIGGTWLALVYGFAGMRDHGGRISFRPCLPAEWQALRFSLLVRGSHLRVEVTPRETRYRLKDGGGLTLRHDGEEIALSARSPEACRANRPPSASEPDPDRLSPERP